MIIGLTGSLGSGKSTVADMLVRLGGAVVIDTDQVVRDLQRRGEAGFEAIVAEFGNGVVGADGELDRRRLADIVFNDAAKLERLNGIVHPMVWEKSRELMESYRDRALVVFMVPLLFETGTDSWCDAVVVVSISEAERVRRLMARDGLSQKDIELRLAAQMPQSEKVARADHVIDNSGSQDATRAQVESLLERLGVVAPGAG